MGRRRRRIVKVVKKKLPTVFSCPSCGEEAIRVIMSRGKGHATVQCAACGLKQEVETSPADQMVDVYCRFTDRFYGATQTPALKQAHTESPPEGPVLSETQIKDEERHAEVESSSEQQTETSETSELPSEEFELDADEASKVDEARQ